MLSNTIPITFGMSIQEQQLDSKPPVITWYDYYIMIRCYGEAHHHHHHHHHHHNPIIRESSLRYWITTVHVAIGNTSQEAHAVQIEASWANVNPACGLWLGMKMATFSRNGAFWHDFHKDLRLEISNSWRPEAETSWWWLMIKQSNLP